MWRSGVWHPVIYAFVAVLSLFSNNTDELSLLDGGLGRVILPCLITFIMSIALYTSCRALFADPHKRGVATLFALVTFCSYGHFRDFYRSTIVGTLGVELRFDLWALGGFQFGTFKLYLICALGVFSLGFWALRRSRRNFSALTRALNVFAAALLMISMSRILWSEIAVAATPSQLSNRVRDSLTGGPGLARDVSSRHDTKTHPNIYYIVLDSYASAHSLQTYYDFDNSSFLAALEKRGFFVASQSRSNYAFTSLSIPSALNMSYLNYLSDELGVTSTDFKPVYEMVRRNVVMERLKSYGYHTAVISSGYAVTSSHVFADTTIKCKRAIADDHFVMLCLNVSVLGEILTHYSLDRKRQEILCQFEAVRSLSRTPGPHFVFAHILSPHYPYIFDDKGDPVSPVDHMINSKDHLYVDQLQFVNRAVTELVDDILANTDRELVMVLQADHGPWDIGPTSGVEGHRNRMRIFNSYPVLFTASWRNSCTWVPPECRFGGKTLSGDLPSHYTKEDTQWVKLKQPELPSKSRASARPSIERCVSKRARIV